MRENALLAQKIFPPSGKPREFEISDDKWAAKAYNGENLWRAGECTVTFFDAHSDIWTDVTIRRMAGEERVLERRDYDPDFVAGYRGLARYFTKEVPEVGRHPWGCSQALGKHIPRPRIGASVSGAVRPPPGAALLPADDVPKLTGWGVFGYCRYLVAGS